MRRGFTILELLVASLLLGMVTSIMTMVMNQSSISWRMGTAIVKDLDNVRDNMAALREEADNAFVWDGTVYRIISPWSQNGSLRRRACDADRFEAGDEVNADANHAHILRKTGIGQAKDPWTKENMINDIGKLNDKNGYRTYMVNVMSGGPKNDITDWQAIWSYPDDFD